MDGRVLVVGGAVEEDSLDSCEIYDPTLDRWTSSAPFCTARYDHAATLLPDGSVLIAGGTKGANPNPVLSSTEIFSPRKETWHAGQPLDAPRHRVKFIRLPDGRTILFGSAAAPLAYEPAAGTWEKLSALQVLRVAGFTISASSVGRVILSGGALHTGEPTTRVDICDPVENSWSDAEDMVTARTEHEAVTLADGSGLLVTGGYHRVPVPPSSPFAPGKKVQLVRSTKVQSRGDSIIPRFPTSNRP